jgi:predicted nuclease of predicted toxin-antitoxin system
MEKLYVNENFPLPIVLHLRKYGYDVLTSLEAGNANQSIPDDLVLSFSTSQNRVLLTINRKDFIKLHRLNPIHTGIIVCTEDADFQALATRIHNEISNNSGQMANNLLRVYRPVI